MTSSPADWKAKVGDRVRDRRGTMPVREAARRATTHIQAIKGTDKAQVSEGTWRTIESGQRQLKKGVYDVVNPRPDTRAAVCRVLMWTDDSIDRLLEGLEPTSVNLADLESVDAKLARIIATLNDAAPTRQTLRALTSEVAEMVETVREMKDTMTDVQATVADVRAVSDLVKESLAQAARRGSS